MLVMAQKAIQGNKEKEVALIASSSKTKKKGNKRKKGKATVREDKGKGKCFHCQERDIGREIVPSTLSPSRLREKVMTEKVRLSLVYLLLRAHLMLKGISYATYQGGSIRQIG